MMSTPTSRRSLSTTSTGFVHNDTCAAFARYLDPTTHDERSRLPALPCASRCDALGHAATTITGLTSARRCFSYNDASA